MREVEYRTLAWLPGYRIGSDGSVWSCRKKGGTREQRFTAEWHRCNAKPLTGRLRGGRKRNPAWQVLVRTNTNRVVRVYVHRLVLEAFCGPAPSGMIGCHNDGNPANNVLENLRWDTPKGNAADMHKHGTVMHGTRNHRTKVDEETVLRMMELLKDHAPKQVSEILKVSLGIIWQIARGSRWSWLTGIQYQRKNKVPRMRLNKKVREGLYEMLSIADTILQQGGEGWALECSKGEGMEPCNQKGCPECDSRKELELAVSWLSQFLSGKKEKRIKRNPTQEPHP